MQARPNDPPPPWKDADLRRMKETVERAGLKLGNVMLHDFRRAILGRPGADEDIELVKESIRAAGRAGIPIVEYNWYALRAMGGYYEEPGRGGSRLAAHDYARSKDLPALDDVGTHSATDLWARYERFLKAVVPVAEQAERAARRAPQRSAAAALSRHRADPRLGRRPEARLRDGEEPGQRHHPRRRRHP